MKEITEAEVESLFEKLEIASRNRNHALAKLTVSRLSTDRLQENFDVTDNYLNSIRSSYERAAVDYEIQELTND